MFRDLLMSFLLPRSVVGVRRTSLLGREANTLATQQHSSVLGTCHDCAMRGCLWSWRNEDDPLVKICALLAGICISMVSDSQAIRKSPMFGGRISLPFLSFVFHTEQCW